jgi:hypothetical protein
MRLGTPSSPPKNRPLVTGYSGRIRIGRRKAVAACSLNFPVGAGDATGPATLATKGGGQRRTDAGDRIEPLACFAGAMPGPDQAVELQNLRLQHPQVGAESGNTGTCDLRQSFVICVGNDAEQLLDTIASDRRAIPNSAR